MVIGFLGYGLSLVLFVLGLRHLGASAVRPYSRDLALLEHEGGGAYDDLLAAFTIAASSQRRLCV